MSQIPTVISGLLKDDSGHPIKLDSPQWLEWLNHHSSFRYEPRSEESGFTVRAERSGYWYGYRKQQGKLHKRYIGKSESLTVDRLENIALLLNEPQQPRGEQVTQKRTQELPVTAPGRNDDIALLWDAIAALRLEVATLGKLVSSPVVDEATGLTSFLDESTVTHSQGDELQNQVTELENEIEKLQKRIIYLDEQLKLAEEMNQECLEIKTSHLLSSNELRFEREKLQQSEAENQRLRQENQELQNKSLGNPTPDYNSLRDHVVASWKIAKRAESKERIKEALNRFIQEIHSQLINLDTDIDNLDKNPYQSANNPKSEDFV